MGEGRREGGGGVVRERVGFWIIMKGFARGRSRWGKVRSRRKEAMVRAVFGW